jgi:hypothetical protein
LILVGYKDGRNLNISSFHELNGARVNVGRHAIYLACDFSQEDVLKRAYSLAMPRQFGPANLAVSVEELLEGSDVYKLPDESIETMTEKIIELNPTVQHPMPREVLTFDWPTSVGTLGYRIKHPARGAACKHAQCFDLQVHFLNLILFKESACCFKAKGFLDRNYRIYLV